MPAVNTVTFRALSPAEIVSVLKKQDIPAVEWAGDAHAPPGDIGKAREIRALCEEHGIEVCGYGSYYQCDEQGQGEGPFKYNLGALPALESAFEIGSPGVRVWAGRQGSASASESYREEVAGRLSDFCDLAAKEGLQTHLEYHRNTLTDTPASAVALIDAVGKENLRSYWQPRPGVSDEECLEDIAQLGPRLSHLHVYHWRLKEDGPEVERLPLGDAEQRWAKFLSRSMSIPARRFAMIEFVKGDRLEQFAEDAKVLKALIASVASQSEA